jgi:hypothetical protein
MNPNSDAAAIQRRALIAVVLGLVALVLFFLGHLLQSTAPARSYPLSPSMASSVEAVVDTLFDHYAINRSRVKTWRVLSAGNKPFRVEQRIPVTREFPSLVFNFELHRMLQPLGAEVFGTERSKDNVVTMHVVHGGVTVRSMAFVFTAKED